MFFKKYFIFLMLIFMVLSLFAQDMQRSRPKQWDNLAFGGRFIDRFLPIPIVGELSSSSWGVDKVNPRDLSNGIEDEEYSYWGGNIIKADDGKYHLFVCRWKENALKGHMTWPNSSVIHAVCDNSIGPFKFVDEIGKGHNPEIFTLNDGSFILYVIGGYYKSDSISGPWTYGKFTFNKRGRKIVEGLSNLSFAKREDGSILMVCRGGGIWISQNGQTFNQISNASVYPAVERRFEDPVLWKSELQYHIIVNDWYGRIAYYLRSKNGIDWKVDQGEAYLPGIAKYEDGTLVDWYKFERIKILQDEKGRAFQSNFAVIDYLKHKDKSNDNHSSKNISIPLTKSSLLKVLNKQKFDSDTKQIKVKISSEAGFDAINDIDLDSLRFGASKEVNFGAGSKILRTEKNGKNLVLIFDAKGNGLTDNNFVAKLIGRKIDGKLLFGYAKLPSINYNQSILSSDSKVKVKKVANGYKISLFVTNFGPFNFEGGKIKAVLTRNGEDIIVEGQINPFESYKTECIQLNYIGKLKRGLSYDFNIYVENQECSLIQTKVRVY